MISSTTMHVLFSDFRKFPCIAFFLCISFLTRAQIYQANDSEWYVSYGTSIIDLNKEKDTNKTEVKPGKIFVSKGTVIYIDQDAISAQVVVIQSQKKTSTPKKHLTTIPKPKNIKSERVAEPINKSNVNFSSEKSNSNLQIASAKAKVAVSNTNTHLKAIITTYYNINFNKTICKTTADQFIKNESSCTNCINNFSIRPPPVF